MGSYHNVFDVTSSLRARQVLERRDASFDLEMMYASAHETWLHILIDMSSLLHIRLYDNVHGSRTSARRGY
jgi:hypothetical protein